MPVSNEKIKAVKKEISESLANDRHQLLIFQPFIGSVAMRFDLVPIRDLRCRTACTDGGKSIYFDCEFYLSIKPQERVFVLAHEIWHALNCTFMRKQSRDIELWNMATDMEINNILVDSANNLYSPPKDVLFPPANLKGKAAETIYDWLLKQQKKQNQDNTTNSGKNQNSKENGKSACGLSGQFDKHTYNDDVDDSAIAEGVFKDRWGEVGFDDDFNPSIPEDAAERMREIAISAAQAYQRSHGDLPAHVKSLVRKLCRSEINWREYLCSFVSSVSNGKCVWTPPSRRHIWNDMYFQSRRNETLRVTVCVDTSGSCLDDLPKFFGELKGLIETFPSYDIDIIQIDAAVEKVDHYDENNQIPFEYSDGLKICGGGGTDYGPAFTYIDENLNPDCVVFLGDGYASMTYYGKPNYPVLFILTKNGNETFCDWGKKIHFRESVWDD